VARKGFKDRPLDLARVQYRTACAADFASEYSRALRWLSLALRTLDTVQADAEAAALRARIMTHYGFVLRHQGREKLAVRWSRNAAELAEQAAASDALATALTNLYVSLIALGQGDRAIADRALALWSQLDETWERARLHNLLGSHAYYEGDWDDAVSHYEAGHAAALRAGDHWLATICEANIVEVLSDRGELDEAEARMEGVRRMYRAFPVPVTAASGESQMGRILARAGRFEEARALYDAAMATQRKHGAHGDVVETMARLAECLMWQGNALGALDITEQALALAASVTGAAMFEPLLHRVRGQALVLVGRRPEGRSELERALAGAREHHSGHEIAWTLDAMRWLADVDGVALPAALNDELQTLWSSLGISYVRRPANPLATIVLPVQRDVASGDDTITTYEGRPVGPGPR
jgi:tetratricopeptide (TPR) repeat protein